MKLKILTETNYERIQDLFNAFSEAYNVLKVDVCDTGEFVTYHVFYHDKPWSD